MLGRSFIHSNTFRKGDITLSLLNFPDRTGHSSLRSLLLERFKSIVERLGKGPTIDSLFVQIWCLIIACCHEGLRVNIHGGGEGQSSMSSLGHGTLLTIAQVAEVESSVV